MITLVLADDHQVVRQGMRMLLEAQPDFQVVGEASNGLETLRLIESLEPDVAVLDLMMPGLTGLELVREIEQISSPTRIIVFSMYSNEPYVLEALQHGAAGYVLKDAPTDELVRAVREAMAGRRYLSAALSERAIQAYLESTQMDELDPYETLTRREREVLHLGAEGYSNQQIAEQFSISPRTVETHRANLMRKLGLASQTELVRYALQKGILPSS